MLFIHELLHSFALLQRKQLLSVKKKMSDVKHDPNTIVYPCDIYMY